MDPSIQLDILDLVIEDSFALSELVARVRQAHPSLSRRDATERAKETLIAMLRSDLIRVTRLEAPGDEEQALDYSAAMTAFDDELNWLELRHWRPHARVVATDEGQKVFYRRRSRQE